ncbi:DUF2806 domain-containing protein [Dyella caseinilytica]|uniref:DUF2806 domain-containing protein n=1 Tax=Dyella caseinilytica TaxID=1849581 RepID=A0ABX7GZE3_9GAMM|nr:DUF2806 domain-containing protein [Dyella caseinilytica]QRN55308.1 DUF2806 domain-containing protein [Dyella caseinilytica]GGA00862.1 hypothetical protein GCM10011408_22330 [Dyella caseinilytica]
MEIKDLAGLSKPLTRLIEVISQGIGAVSRPYLIRRTADAKAHEVRVIAAALKDVANQHQLPVVFKDGEVELWQKPEDRTLLLDTSSCDERTASRTDYRERKRQNNVESITSVAAADLFDQTEVPDQRPDEDWINRFFSAAEDVSSEQMQELWGRILSGEIKKPGSYSLKTLDFVKNLTKEDATTLEKMSKLAVFYQGVAILPNHDAEWLKTERDLFPGHHFAAGELGAMYPTDLNYRVFQDPSVNQAVFVSGNFVLIVDRASITNEIQLPVWKFTRIGQEILQLIPPDGDEAHLAQLGRFFVSRKATAKLAKIIEKLPNGQIRFQDAKDVQLPADKV